MQLRGSWFALVHWQLLFDFWPCCNYRCSAVKLHWCLHCTHPALTKYVTRILLAIPQPIYMLRCRFVWLLLHVDTYELHVQFSVLLYSCHFLWCMGVWVMSHWAYISTYLLLIFVQGYSNPIFNAHYTHYAMNTWCAMLNYPRWYQKWWHSIISKRISFETPMITVRHCSLSYEQSVLFI